MKPRRPAIPVPVTKLLSDSVLEDLPEIADIKDAGLRESVIRAWAMALASSSFDRISEIPGEGHPKSLVLKRGNQADHLRGVANLSTLAADDFAKNFPEVVIHRDILLAGALCHDIGKTWECDPENLHRWAEDPAEYGEPSIRHPPYGVHLCLAGGLPESVAHIAGAHSAEGDKITRSVECVIVNHADHMWWWMAGATGMLQEDSFDKMRPGVYPRKLRTEK